MLFLVLTRSLSAKRVLGGCFRRALGSDGSVGPLPWWPEKQWVVPRMLLFCSMKGRGWKQTVQVSKDVEVTVVTSLTKASGSAQTPSPQT